MIFSHQVQGSTTLHFIANHQ